MVVDEGVFTGEPSRWPYDPETKEWVVHWKIDKEATTKRVQGKTIYQIVKELFDKWKETKLPDPDAAANVPEEEKYVDIVSLRIEHNEAEDVLPQDVTLENYQNYVTYEFDPGAIPPTVVIYDQDGSILSAMGYPRNIAGLGAPLNRSGDRTVIQNGYVILNGRMIEGVNDAREVERFKAVILHELGHLFNLSHSQLNLDLAESCDTFNCPNGYAITTMYPSAKSTEQFLFHRDDVIALALLYPKMDENNKPLLETKYCTIKGTILDKEGNGYPGVNVVANNVKADQSAKDARSMVSGAFFPGPSIAGRRVMDGQYVLAGLMPGETYEVHYESLTHDYDVGGGFMPLGTESPDVGEGLIAADVPCHQGGEVITLSDFQISGQASEAPLPDRDINPAGLPPTKKGWFCQLQPEGADWRSGFVYGFFLFLLSILLACRRRLLRERTDR